MEDICSKLQDIRNPIQAIGLLLREMDYETDVELEKEFSPGRSQKPQDQGVAARTGPCALCAKVPNPKFDPFSSLTTAGYRHSEPQNFRPIHQALHPQKHPSQTSLHCLGPPTLSLFAKRMSSVPL